MTPGSPCLVGDIGGTHARFALVVRGQVQLNAIGVLPCKDYATLAEAIAAYLQRTGTPRVHEACLAVAAPAQNHDVQMTNNHWRFNTGQIREHFGWSSFRVVNDFVAMALGVPHVGGEQLVPVCGGPGDSRRPRLVMGPGTGLGVSALIPASGGYLPLITEGGHVDYAPTTERDIHVLRILRRRFGRVSAERVLCGEGLLNLYQAHAEIQGLAAPLASPERVSAAALKGSCPLALEALQHFCEILGRTAGNAVLTQGSFGGVYLCGGMLPKFLDFFLASPFQEGFEDKGRMRSLQESTPVYVVTEPTTGLLGAAVALSQGSD
ncbi:glucokinase [Marinobacter sp. VGCF2001]|uniref:glucokinase n=1 Tax=Marinobacter sp. VGCF2001 TaxID=3417189 RepID=UPI003CE6865C